METRPALKSLYCVNSECKDFGQMGHKNLKVRKIYGKDKIRYLRCRSCGEEFSERKGTALFNSKIREAKAAAVIDHLDSRCGVVATAKLVGVCKDAVSRLVRVSGRASKSLHNKFVRKLKPKALQFDEKWSYSSKKQKNVTAADDPTQTGDRWDVNCLDPHTKLLITVVPGKRTAESIHNAVKDAKSRLAADAPIPAIFTDGEPAYCDAILDLFGHRYAAPKSGKRGRPANPVMRVPHGLVYAQVVKHRKENKVVEVEVRPIFGKSKLAQVVKDLNWKKANTSAIERFNLTDRARNGRKVRKTLQFSKRARFHDWMSYITALRYNFHHPHRSLRVKTDAGSWLKRSPAMAAGLTDHICSSIELLRLCTVGLG